jgi:hypothetical protein
MGAMPRLCSLAIAIIMMAHLALLVGGLGANFVTGDEVRRLPAWLAAWKTGGFSLANDSPPLAGMIAALPTLLSRIYLYTFDLKITDIVFDSSLREREGEYGAHFA